MAGLANPKRLGIFGGTFDPPHLGHLILASECLHQLRLERVLWVLTPTPPHKPMQNISPLHQRLALLETAIGELPEFELSRVDIERPSPHYAVDTMHLLRERFPDTCLVYIMGLDSLRDLPSWYEPDVFIQSVDGIGVVTRPGIALEIGSLDARFAGLAIKISLVQMPEIGISSSDIRKRIKESRPYRFFLPQPVYELIKRENYYHSHLEYGY